MIDDDIYKHMGATEAISLSINDSRISLSLT